MTTHLRFYNSTRGSNVHARENGLIFQTIEIETIVKAICIDDQIGKEIVLAINDTGIKNEGVFFTNSNGLEAQRRVRNSVSDVTESVAGNYYPVNSAIYIEDSRTGSRVTLMNDRSQGGSSVQDEAIEVMIH